MTESYSSEAVRSLWARREVEVEGVSVGTTGTPTVQMSGCGRVSLLEERCGGVEAPPGYSEEPKMPSCSVPSPLTIKQNTNYLPD